MLNLKIKKVLFICILTIFCFFTGPRMYDQYILQPKLLKTGYGKYYSKDDMEYAKKELYPKVTTREKTSDLYFKALQEGNKRSVWLLSSPDKPYYEGETWLKEFDTFWNAFASKKFTHIRQLDSNNHFCTGVSVQLENLEYRFCIEKRTIKHVFNETEYYTVITPPDAGPWTDREPDILDKR
jgi:hypothetical protein